MEKSGNFYIEEAESDFKRVHKSIILNKDIDCLTLGIYVKILVLGKKWQLNIKGLSSYFDISDMKIRKSISLLEKEGYISRKAVQDEKTGKLAGWNYTLHAIPLEESKRTCAGRKNNEETVYPENRQHGYPTTRLSDNTETGEDNNNKLKEDINLNELNKPNKQEEKEDKSSSKKKNTFQFRQSIIDLGVKPEIVDDWLIVRKNKRASNTETAFKRIKSEIAKSGRSANDCITLAVERSWQGFMAEWMLNEINKVNNQKPKPKTQEEINREKLNMPIINDDGDLPDGTFFKNGKRWYFSKQEGRAASCAPDASPRPNDRAEYDWAIKDWRVPRDKWEASDEIW